MTKTWIYRRMALAAALVFLGSIVYSSWNAQSAPKASADELAKNLVATCASAADNTQCYENEVPKLYPQNSIPEVFEIIRRIRAQDSSYQFCHVLAHKLGEAVVAEDPSQWMRAIPLNPSDGMCSNGFVHGVVGGRFRAEVLDDETLDRLIPEFRMACEPHDGWSPSPLDQAICYHGMGHLYVFITDANLRKALSICEQTTISDSGNFGQVCREGVFMQIYQPLEPDDFLMIERMDVKPSTTTVRQFCKAYSDVPEYEGACLRESWPYFRKEITDGSGVEKFCSGQPNEAEELNCYRSATAIIGRMTLGNKNRGAQACGELPERWQGQCFVAVASAIVEEDRAAGAGAVGLCMAAEIENVRNSCISELASRSRFFFGNNEEGRQAFCTVFPASFQERCRR